MKRKTFFKSAFFGFVGLFLTRIVAAPKQEKKKDEIMDDFVTANLKLQQAIVRLKPQGTYIDLRYLRALSKEMNKESEKYTMQQLLDLIYKHIDIK